MDSTAALKRQKQLHESGFKLTPQRKQLYLYYWKMKRSFISRRNLLLGKTKVRKLV